MSWLESKFENRNVSGEFVVVGVRGDRSDGVHDGIVGVDISRSLSASTVVQRN